MSETVLGEYGIKASKMAPSQMQAVEHLAAECATLRARVADLEAAREAMLAVCTDADPHDRTYPYVCLAESGNPIIEAATLADAIRQLARWGDAGYAKAAKAEAQLATARAEEREHALEAGRIEALYWAYEHYADDAGVCTPATLWVADALADIRSSTPTPEPPHA